MSETRNVIMNILLALNKNRMSLMAVVLNIYVYKPAALPHRTPSQGTSSVSHHYT